MKKKSIVVGSKEIKCDICHIAASGNVRPGVDPGYSSLPTSENVNFPNVIKLKELLQVWSCWSVRLLQVLDVLILGLAVSVKNCSCVCWIPMINNKVLCDCKRRTTGGVCCPWRVLSWGREGVPMSWPGGPSCPGPGLGGVGTPSRSWPGEWVRRPGPGQWYPCTRTSLGYPLPRDYRPGVPPSPQFNQPWLN